LFRIVNDTAGAPLFAGVATLAIYSALMLRSRAMLAAAILGLLGFITAYAEQHFAHSVSWPLLLIVFGFILLLAGFAFARLSGMIREPSLQKTY
jgi:amino acid transporter